MSNSQSASAQPPKRQRGYIRVAAIIDAGVAVFTEKGYDAATMTEIAARSKTAIGSLYRFFPSKESLADALLLQYSALVTGRLTELETAVQTMPADRVADALVDFSLALQSQRSFAISLVEQRAGLDAKRLQLRTAMRSGVAGILQKTHPHLSTAKSNSMAIVVLHMLKGLAFAGEEKPAQRRLVVAEIRTLLQLYLASSESPPESRK